MPKFWVYASEKIYYMKEVEADSEDDIRRMVGRGDIDFEYSDITDGADFELGDIEQEIANA